MIEIDFLPASYRQMTVHRKANVWRLLAGGIFVAMIAFSAVYQHSVRREALLDLTHTGAQYDRAHALMQQQTELKRQLQTANTEAELYTYLRHPWPATQVLAAALAPLPDCITVHQIRLFNDDPHLTAAVAPQSVAQKKAVEIEPAADRDLQQLRRDNDGRPRVLILSGITTDTPALQHYLLELEKTECFTKIELGSLEADASDHSAAMHFTTRLIVRPGYGQPGGPAVESNGKPRSTVQAVAHVR